MDLILISCLLSITILTTEVCGQRTCYVCTGNRPDRECETNPTRVSHGGKVACTKNFCTTHVRYEPREALLDYNKNGHGGRAGRLDSMRGSGRPIATMRPLTIWDYDITSIARSCDDTNRGNVCERDWDGLGLTCWSTCTSDGCNSEAPRAPAADLFTTQGPANNDVVNYRETVENNKQDRGNGYNVQGADGRDYAMENDVKSKSMKKDMKLKSTTKMDMGNTTTPSAEAELGDYDELTNDATCNINQSLSLAIMWVVGVLLVR